MFNRLSAQQNIKLVRFFLQDPHINNAALVAFSGHPILDPPNFITSLIIQSLWTSPSPIPTKCQKHPLFSTQYCFFMSFPLMLPLFLLNAVLKKQLCTVKLQAVHKHLFLKRKSSFWGFVKVVFLDGKNVFTENMVHMYFN